MKASEQISAFLDLLRRAQTDHSIAGDMESDADKETQDILHWSEFQADWASAGEKAAVMDAQSLVRQRRRNAKDIIETTAPIVLWADENRQVVKSIERLLGVVRKAEKGTENRHYTDRTDIIKRTLDAVDEDGKDTQGDESGL